MQKLQSQVEDARVAFAQAERQGDFAKASMIKYGTLVELEKKIAAEQSKLAKLTAHFVKEEVDEEDIAVVLARWIKVPVEKLREDEGQKLIAMETELHKRVIGQEEAITAVADTIRIYRAGIADPAKPLGSFLFLGPTGVGKTEVARTLADYLFNDAHKMIRIDMSEYMEKHTVARLIGSPPGYIGYEEGGQLTEAIRRHPYSVILFDEIEKAHPDVFNLFLQMLDEGHLTDSQGRTVSCKNCIIIMTSNLGSDLILEAGQVTLNVREKIEQLLLKKFRPEFLNRIDKTVFFRSLEQQDMELIARVQLQEVVERMNERGILLKITDAAVVLLSQLGFIKEFGARPLKRAIAQQIVTPLAVELLTHPEKKVITIDVIKDKITIS